MAFASGMSESLRLAFESSFKTLPGTVNAELLPVISPNIRPSRNKFQPASLTGSPEPRPAQFGKVAVDGDFKLESSHLSLLFPLKALFGTLRTGGVTGGIYTNEFTLGTPLPIAIEQAHTDVSAYFKWNGCYISRMSMDISAEGLMETTFGIVGAKQTISASTMVNGSTTDRTGGTPFSYLLGMVKQGGSTIGYVQSASLTVDRKMGRAVALDQTNESAAIFSEIADISGRAVMLFQDTTFAALASAGTETSLEFFIPGDLGTAFRVQLPTVRFSPAAPTTNGTGLVSLEADFTAYARGTSSATKASVRSGYIGATIAGLNTKTLLINPNGGGNQTITFVTADDTLDELVTKINATLTNASARAERASGDVGGCLVIETTLTGSTKSIQIDVTSTADTDLFFDNTSHTGLDGKAIVVEVMSTAQMT